MHKFHPSIFREYDIRGIFNETLFSQDAYQIGVNYAELVGKGTICVGFDGRLSSPELADKLIQGLIESGVNVVNIGLGPTPLLYFSVFHLNADGGIMVTGSHNPPTHNGFKIMLGKESMHGDEIRALNKIVDKKSLTQGKVEKKNLKEEYLKKITANLPLDVKIGFDPGNGAAGEIALEISKKLGAQIINEKIDGNFPSHHPDPTVEENLEQLKDLISKNKLDVGFAFDGDGDRVGVVDNKGRPIWGDQILAILSKDVLKKNPGAPIVADVKTSQTVFDYIEKLGGKPVMWKTGHSLIKSKMKELNAPLAGEMSAHIFIKDDYFGFDDGLYAAMRFLQVMQSSGKSSSELLDELPKSFSSPEIRIKVEEEKKFQIVENIKSELKKANDKFSDVDGVRVNNQHGWWLLRASNTGGYLVARAEGVNEKALSELLTELKNYLKSQNVIIE